MIDEEVEVVSIIDKNTAEVLKLRAEACSSCGSASICGVKKELKFKAENPKKLDLKVGERVKIEIPEISLTKISLIVYGIPTLSLILSLVVFLAILKLPEINSLLFSLIPLLLSICVVRLYDKNYRAKKGNKPRIIEIIK